MVVGRIEHVIALIAGENSVEALVRATCDSGANDELINAVVALACRLGRVTDACYYLTEEWNEIISIETELID